MAATDRSSDEPAGRGIFRSLRNHNYRLWAGGAIVSNVGTWMQRTAQDWLVLTQLTHHNATAVGIVMALQFGPQLLLLPWTGFAADHLDRRKLLIATQAAMGAARPGAGPAHGHRAGAAVARLRLRVPARLRRRIRCAGAPDLRRGAGRRGGPAQRGGANSTSFNAARMIGPAVAGLLIAAVGTGWVFLVNAASFVAVLISLTLLRVAELRPSAPCHAHQGSFIDGLPLCLGPPRPQGDPAHAVPDRHVRPELSRSSSRPWRSACSTPARGLRPAVVDHGDRLAVGRAARRAAARGRASARCSSAPPSSALGCTLAALMPSYWLFGLPWS